MNEPFEQADPLNIRDGISRSNSMTNNDNPPSSPTHTSRPDTGLSLYNPLSSITELRSKGESRRFMDEIGYLFEGLDARSSVGLSRSSALEMVGRFCDAGFLKRAKAAGFVERAWEVLRVVKAGEGDKVCISSLLWGVLYWRTDFFSLAV